jgi:hypothetical protein
MNSRDCDVNKFEAFRGMPIGLSFRELRRRITGDRNIQIALPYLMRSPFETNPETEHNLYLVLFITNGGGL